MQYIAVVVQPQNREDDTLFGPFDTKEAAEIWAADHGATEIWYMNTPQDN